jgi:hypothetical protein
MSQTLHEALIQIRAIRPMSLRQLQRLIADLAIKPVGARQRPQPYPSDTAARVLTHLGLAQDKTDRLVSMATLKKSRKA